MKLSVVGCSHKSAPIEVRERWAFSTSQVAAALEQFTARFADVEAVILSTCNRVELYTAAQEEGVVSREKVARFFAAFHGHDLENSAAKHAGTDVEYLYHYTDACAVEHLFKVAAGLDSMVVGETQILAQVKEAYRLATEHGATGPVLHAAFQAALQAARRVSCQTDIQQYRVSIPSIAVCDFARAIFERFDDKKTLVIGAGNMAEETLAYLAEQGAGEITVVNRCLQHAADLAARWHGRAVEWRQLDEALRQADLVVSTTSSAEPIVTADDFQPIQAARGDRPLLILDLAVPRDFDAAVGRMPEVFLYSVDDLQAACEENRRRRDKQLPAAEAIITQQIARFMADQRLRAAGPLICRLREDWQRPKEQELRRLLGKIDVSPEAEEAIRQSFDRLINKLLNAPLQSLRSESRHGIPSALADALSRLFRLRD